MGYRASPARRGVILRSPRGGALFGRRHLPIGDRAGERIEDERGVRRGADGSAAVVRTLFDGVAPRYA